MIKRTRSSRAAWALIAALALSLGGGSLGACGGSDLDFRLPNGGSSSASSGGGGQGGEVISGGGQSGEAGGSGGVGGSGGSGGSPPVFPDVLPVIEVDTMGQPIEPDVKIDASMYVVEDHDGTLVGIEGRPRSFEGFIGIEVRGSSSVSFPKKSYGLETRDVDGQDQSVSLLGMPPESDWVLYGAYTDKTYMRDKLAYDVGRDFGRYAPRSRFVELFVDGAYQGVYVFLEKIKRSPERVPLPKVAPDAASGDITGGYILKLEDGDASGGFYSALGTAWQYHYPNPAVITPDQETYVQKYVDAFEAMMAGPSFSDPVKGYAAWIDVPSFVDFFIMNELSRNVDGYRKSAYMYKNSDAFGGTIYMGPLWDFNIAFGNADYCDGESVQGFQYIGGACVDQDRIPEWWKRLLLDASFTKALRCRWNELRKGLLADAALAARLDAYADDVKVAEPRDHELWQTLGVYVWPNPYVGQTFSDEIQYLKQWMKGRAAWLDQNMPGVCP